MVRPFHSHATQWIERQEKAVAEYSQRFLAAECSSSQSNIERFIRTAASAKPPILLPSFAQESLQPPCSGSNMHDEGAAVSFDLDPSLSHSAQIPLGLFKLIPLPCAHLLGDTTFERQDPQTVHTKLETIASTFVGIGGHLYQIREVIDYWLPKDSPAALELARLRWWPSQLVEQARLRTIHEINSIQMGFIENLQSFNTAICHLREGAYGGRLNTKTVKCAREMFETLRDLRSLLLPIQRPAADRVKSLSATSTWLAVKCLVPLRDDLHEPYKAERLDPSDPAQAHLPQLFSDHCLGLTATIKFLSEAYGHLAETFRTIDGICKTMIEGIHKLMHDVHQGQTCGDFVASWAERWERVTLVLHLRLIGLPAINHGLQKDFPTMEVEYFVPE